MGKKQNIELPSGKEENPRRELPSGVENVKSLPPHNEKLLSDKPRSRKLTEEEARDILENKQYGVISYLYILGLVVLLARRDSLFATFHAKQGMVILVLATIFLFAPTIIMVPAELALLCAIFIGVIQARNGFYYKIPVIYDLMPGKLSDDAIPPFNVTLREFWHDIKTRVADEKRKKSLLDNARKREAV